MLSEKQSLIDPTQDNFASTPEIFPAPQRIDRKTPLDLDDLKSLIDNKVGLLKKWGYSHIEFIPQDYPTIVKDYNGNIFAVAVTVFDQRQDDYQEGWLQLKVLPTGHCQYIFSLNGKALAEYEMPPQFENDWIQEESRVTKKVKSRPPFLYPELFALPPEEIWLKESKTLVIGDPYQACDKEGVTIVEYEYAEEITPPVIKMLASGWEADKIREAAASLYQGLHEEDLRSLENVHGSLASPRFGNPYELFARQCFKRCGEIFTDVTTGKQEMKNYVKELGELRAKLQRLLDGSWGISEYINDFKSDSSTLLDEARQGLREYFVIKQAILDRLGNPSYWEDYINEWRTYLDNYPYDIVRGLMPNFEKKLGQVKYWMEELSKIKSQARITHGIKEMMDFYNETKTYASINSQVGINQYHRPALEDVGSRGMLSDNPFGYFTPGFVLSVRARKFLEECAMSVERAAIYVAGIYPKLEDAVSNSARAGVKMDVNTLSAYCTSFERPLAREYLFKKRTQRAVPVHGFFPYEMPPVDEQDRILALTSVTMHGWNNLDYDGFKNDFVQALKYLKVGGKYILGPINQDVYFGRPESRLDVTALMSALDHLKKDDRIDFYFMKAVPAEESTDMEYAPRFEDPVKAEKLQEGEAAHSLVITRLK